MQSLLGRFFIFGNIPSNAEDGVFIPYLVVLSYIIAVLASFTGLRLATNIHKAETEKLKSLLHLGGAFAFGIGIWSMHFIGMLAYDMDMALAYDPFLTIISMIIAISIAYGFLQIIRSGILKIPQLCIGAILLGIAICAMHYTGMAAMKMDGDLRYIPSLFILSWAIAVTASGAALGIVFMLEQHEGRRKILWQIVAALIMGAAICGMHYTGIAASVFIPYADCRYNPDQHFNELAIIIAIMSSTIFVVTIILSFYQSKKEMLQKAKQKLQEKGQENIGRTVFKQLSALLGFLMLLFVGSSLYVLQTQAETIDNGAIVNSAGLQRMLIQRYTREISATIAAGAVKDWKTVLKSKKDSAHSEKLIDINFKGFLEGGTIILNADGSRTSSIEPLAFEKAIDAIKNAKEQWEVLRRTATVTLQANTSSVVNDPHYKYLSDQANYASQLQDNAVRVVEEEITADATYVIMMQQIMIASSLAFFLITIAYVYFRISLPINALYGEIKDHRDNLEKRVVEQTKLLKKETEKIKKQTLLLNTLLDNMPLSIFAKDAADEYKWVMINKTAEDIFCLKKENVIGHVDYDFFPKEESDFFRATDEKVMADGKIVEIDAEPVTTPNGTFTAHTIKVPIYDENNKPSILLGILEDVTEKFKIQEELHIAMKQAESANVAKSDFLANMSHELRTPLNSILGMNRLLLETELKPEQYELADTVFRSSVDLLGIVNDILDLSKIEAGEMELERIGFDITYAFYSVIHALGHIASEKRLIITKNYDSNAFPYVVGDPLRFTRILTNLIGNAIKYTDRGKVEFRAFCKNIENGRIEIRCEIEDTGIGISEDKLEKIFEKFGQADTSTTRKYGGTGLGLAITKELVEMMGGEIGVKSKLGKGSLFWISIPFETIEELSPTNRSEKNREATGTVPVSHARILLAEDHPANQILARKVMKKFGVGTFEIMNNGVELLNRYKEAAWDVILMDCHMPEMNGYDATMEIRKLEKVTGKHTPIVAMTANAMVGEKEKCLRYGMDDYMSKPINIDELKDILGQWLDFDSVEGGDKKDIKPKENVPVDLSQLRTFTDGDKDLEKEFMKAFVTQSDKNLRTLEENVTGKSNAWVEASHMMKGGAGGIGAFELQHLCGEAQSFKGTEEERQLLFEKIRDEYARIKKHLTSINLI